ncbi:MAG TPA: hydrogenase maturation nickel metallochaperone HypA [Burkholderiales bacterium]|nr:hydrogenase maturation nickel metallochaperone HypA [Burkholderiales bacterium]
MHELALSESIVQLVLECARSENLHAVTRVTLEVGAGAGVEAEALRFCFDIVSADTPAQGAELRIETVPLRGRCLRCAAEFEPASLVDSCPTCGAYAPELLSGRELRVKSLDGE